MDDQPVLQETTETNTLPELSRHRRGPYAKIDAAIRNHFIVYMRKNDVLPRVAGPIFGINPSTAHSIWHRYEQTGPQVSSRGGARVIKVTSAIKEYVASLVENSPDLTLKAIAQKVLLEKQLHISLSTAMRVCTSIGFTYKLLRLVPQARNEQEQIEARYEYASLFMLEAPDDRRNLIWADETGFNLHIRRKKGRSMIGSRAAVTVPNSKGRNISVATAMSAEGLIYHQIQFGSFTSQLFADWITNLGVALANQGRRDCWVVLDNVRFHHSGIVAEAAQRLGLKLIFLPTYSPMLNPIEYLFSKWKGAIKTSGGTYTREGLLEAMELGRQGITMQDCLGWIRESERSLSKCLQRLPLD
jgi:transposase